MLADGSEYRGDYDPGDTALREVHAPRIEALLDAGVDLLAFETIPTVREAEVLVGLLDEFEARAWLSYSCRDGSSTSAGEPIAAAIAVGRPSAGRRRGDQLHPAPAPAGAAGGRAIGHGEAPHRLPEPGRPVGPGCPALARG